MNWLVSLPLTLFGIPLPVLGAGDENVAIRVAVANGVFISLYWISVLTSVDSNDVPEQHKWADSVYFLGFIFTLIALITALTSIRDLDSPNAIKGIVVQNAIALSSTAFALVVRTYWKLGIREIHTEIDFVEMLRVAYTNLENQVLQTTETFKERSKEMTVAGRSLESSIFEFGNKINSIEIDPQMLAQIVGQTVNHAFESMSGDIEALKTSLSDAALQIGKSVSDFMRNIAELDARAQFEEQLSATFTNLQETMVNSWNSTFSNVTKQTQSLENALISGQKNIEKFGDELRTQALGFSLTDTISKEANEAFSIFGDEATKKMSMVLEPLATSVEALSDQLERSIRHVGTANEEFQEQLLTLDVAEQISSSISPALSSLSRSLEMQILPIQETLASLSNGASSLQSSFQELAGSQAVTIRGGENLLVQAQDMANFLSAYKDELESVLASIESSAKFVENSAKIQGELQELRAVLKDIASIASDDEGEGNSWKWPNLPNPFRRK